MAIQFAWCKQLLASWRGPPHDGAAQGLGPGELRGLDTSTVSRRVRALEDAGLLTRTDDPADRRASLLQITDAGRDLLIETRRAWAAVVGEATVGWSNPDRTTLTNLMIRLAGSMHRLAAEMENG